MHLVGKILVVFVLVLSIFLMAFAGVVYNTHMSWRDATMAEKKKVEKAAKDLNDARTESERLVTEMKEKITAAEQKAAGSEADNQGLRGEVARLKKEVGDAQLARKTAAEQSVISGEEAVARHDEAASLRKLNHEQAQRIDAEFSMRTKLEDQVHSLQLDFDAARQKNRDLLAKVSVMQQALQSAGITADANELATKNSPPPRVEGIIEEVKPGKRQGSSELVEISLGSDDGMKVGHEATVYRSGLKAGQQAKYLGKILIVKTTPDKSVGQVIESSRNGVIKKGDNVTTRL